MLAPGLHLRALMRNTLLLGLVAIATVSLLGCGDANAGNGGRLRRGVPAPGAQETHDDGDSEDEDAIDPGNPNADSKPNAPSGAGQGASQFALKLSTNTPSVDLGEKVDIDVTVEPQGGFTGPVNVSVTGLPAGAAAAPLTVTVASGAATGKLSITSEVSAVPSAPNTSSALTITASAGTTSATATANFKINPKLKLTIPVNIDALRAAGGTTYRNEWGAAFGANPTPLRTQTGNGIVVNVFNADSKNHIIHGANGFAHGSTQGGQEIKPNSYEMQNGAPRIRTLNPGVSCNGYPHEGGNGPSASFRISVVQAN